MKRIFSLFTRLFNKKPDSPIQAEGNENKELQEPETNLQQPSPPPPANSVKKHPSPPPRKRPKWTEENFPVPPVEGKTRFHDFDLPRNLMHAIADLKFDYCMPVQAEVIPYTLKGRDATARAQTGTGKSAAFLVTVITRLLRTPIRGKRTKGTPRALIIAPTRELVIQIEKDARALLKYTPLKIMAVFGGMGYKQQQARLQEQHIDIITATPGRLIDFTRQKLIDNGKVEILVLDEADRMLDMGFIPDVRRIIYSTPHKDKRQTLFFSATLPPEILRMATQWTENAAHVEIDPDHTVAEGVNQKVFIVTEDEKFILLYNLIHGQNLDRVILFVNRRSTTRILRDRLERYGLSGAILSGEVSQQQRLKTLERFRSGKVGILVATDVAARGLHIEGVSHVVNYDLPQEADHYIHRIGRTGRAGAEGIAVSFADEMSSFLIPEIEEVLGASLDCEYPDDALLTPLPPPLKKKKPRSRKPGAGSRPKKSGSYRPARRRSEGSRPGRSKGRPDSKNNRQSEPPKKNDSGKPGNS